MWKKALSEGVCPFAKCDLTKKTCKHLDGYLNYGRQMFEPSAKLRFVDREWLERQEAPNQRKSSVWVMFKELRRLQIPNEYILILTYRYGLGLSLPEIAKHCGWFSLRTLSRHFKLALDMVKQRGYNARRS